MKVFVGGTPFLRALDSQDIPAQPLPYDDITITHTWPGTVANNVEDEYTFDDDDWGAGLDFYMNTLLIGFASGGFHTLVNEDDLILVYLWDIASEYFFRWSYTGKFYTFGHHSATGWVLYRSYFLGRLRKVLSTQDLQFSVLNASGFPIVPSIFISGIVK